MIENFQIRNFRALRDVDVKLRPLTILIGPNDSGKTSFLEALRQVFSPQLSHRDFWRNTEQPALVARYDDGGTTAVSTERLQGLRHSGPEMQIFALPREGPPMQCQGVAGVPLIGPDGSNVPALLDYFLRQDRTRFDSFVATMRKHVPGLEDIGVPTPSPAMREIDVVIDGGFRMPADMSSAGFRLVLFFVALVHHPQLPGLILLEEPENGLHPKRLADVMKLLKSLTRGEVAGRSIQVVLSTHSPFLLDEVDLNEDQVIVFRRAPDGSRMAQAVDRERLKTFLDEFKLGEVWFNRNEEGLLKRPESPAKSS